MKGDESKTTLLQIKTAYYTQSTGKSSAKSHGNVKKPLLKPPEESLYNLLLPSITDARIKLH